MVKKRIFATASILFVTLVAIFIATNVGDKGNLLDRPQKNNVTVYKNKVEYEELPTDCIELLNDKYAICKKVVDLEPDSTFQYTESKETSYLYNIKTGERKLIGEGSISSVALKHIIQNNNVFWIEQQINKKENSGKWAIKEYSIESEKIKVIDEGNFENFTNYLYEDIDFSNEGMLFPINMDVSGNKLVYHRVVETEKNLKFEVVLYDITTGEKEIIASGEDYVNEYYYDVAINNNYVVYNKYHEKNNDNSLRDTTYKYCDLYAYNITTKQKKEITKNDFLINLDINDEYFLAVRVPENEKEQKSFARMQIVMMDIEDLNEKIVLNYKSPIYKNKEDLQIGNPTFMGDYIVWQDNSTVEHMYIYDYRKECFVKIPTPNSESDFSIVGVKENSLMVLELKKNGMDSLYRVIIK